ncbi:hypothetical protein DVA67_012665 [Solirubrobacter sp. CPCC 204708]|uniref:Tetratricopeptide repeat protein n=1 Tax=Solirubrobacter deserti TaxID=2282478 RepID=A0ABT4RKZ7_9ACTN|nr:hypothetical protein [Solirubrobacter deserti]MBE2316828.1 hypothetical protein [Solirubrobacter deserti]MDA0138955.1 hypothetical protein [Solirubrobacter deserti]
MIKFALLTVAAAFAAATVAFTRGDDPATAAPRVDRPVLTGTSADIPALERAVAAGQDDLRPDLALAYLQRARETEDTAFYDTAERALGRPKTPAGLAIAAQLAAARHEFTKALALGAKAGNLGAPIRVDALVELGRLDDAERELQAMIDRRPNLEGYARVSYVRELRGDLDGAVEAMRLALAAGGPSVEHGAYVNVLLGELERRRGRPAASRRAFQRTLALMPEHPEAEMGLARLDAARSLDAGIARLRRLADRLPDFDHLIALGEAELAAGKPARRTFQRVAAKRKTIGPLNADTALELALYEADHGNPREAVRFARFGYREAPSAKAADTLGWALTRAGAPKEGRRYTREALRDGALDPLWLAHAGLTEIAAGGDGRRELRLALAHGLDGHPWQAQQARRALG